MIPKLLHYVWLGKGDLTPSVKRCIESWRKIMPDYEIKCWNEDNFDVNSVVWVKEAIEKKKWSLASDYIRHYALYSEGGIYLDTDVMIYKSLDPFLKYDFFTSIELHPDMFYKIGSKQLNSDYLPIDNNVSVEGLGLLAAALGSVPKNPYIKECMDYFGNRHFIKEDGTLDEAFINPAVMPQLLIKYGFVYKDELQLLDNNMIVLPSNVLAGDSKTRTKDSYLMHWCDSSWREPSTISIKRRVSLFLKKYFPYIFRR